MSEGEQRDGQSCETSVMDVEEQRYVSTRRGTKGNDVKRYQELYGTKTRGEWWTE